VRAHSKAARNSSDVAAFSIATDRAPGWQDTFSLALFH
jgi:hypothetical protein